MNRHDINEQLSEYTERECAHCYASIRERGRIQLDGHFELSHIKGIVKILEQGEGEECKNKTSKKS